MSHLTPLISDLALILICAGITTLIFKKLKQPLVLGYIVAGFLCSPHFQFTPSVADEVNMQIWSEIGVIFLLFALGLDFSFKKMLKSGSSTVIAACTIIFCMILIGMFVGWLFGWKQMDCMFLGGMLAMSSTTIIYKAFDDMGLRQQRFAGIVLSILVLEDILAIVLMVMLTTLAVSKNFEGGEMAYSIVKLVFFLVLWFVVGIYLIPLFLRRVRRLMSNETLLIVSLALCFGMVVLAAKVGFSPAFGAFVMGSILSETIDSERIEHLVNPVKDLFGAIFFVSVGMMVDPAMIVEYIGPIIVIVLAILVGQTVFGTGGVLLSGQPLKIAVQCGFSLTQIGEFAFIIASLGVSLNVTSHFLYPIVVAVSVITTFFTPYMIRLSGPAYRLVDAHLPRFWKELLRRYSAGTSTVNHQNNWKKLLTAILRIVLVYSVLCVAVMVLSFNLFLPLLVSALGDFWGKVAGAAVTIVLVAPFLRAMIMKKNHSIEFKALWADNRYNHAPLISVILLRIILGIGFVVYIVEYLFQTSTALVVGIALVLVVLMIFSRFLKKQSIGLERTFVQNLRSKDVHKVYLGEKRPEYAGRLLDRDLHLSDFTVPADSLWGGKTLRQIGLRNKFGVHVSSILRGIQRINTPNGDMMIFPGDRLQAIGSDDQLTALSSAMNREIREKDPEIEKREMKLRQVIINADGAFAGKTMKESGIRDKFNCMVIGIEEGKENLSPVDPSRKLEKDDIIWIVGEEEDIKRFNENN